jgi:predicted lipid-binding transport protein (Tim44 family)
MLTLLATLLGFCTLSQDAEAKRMGGGKSIGISRDSGVMKREGVSARPAAPSQQSAAQAPAAPQSGMSRWMGPLAGIAAGLGVAALFSHFGMGAGMANVLLVVLVIAGVALVAGLLLRRRQPAGALHPAMQYAGADAGMPVQAHTGRFASAGFGGVIAEPTVPRFADTIPAGFDVEGFLRQAKLSFIRLQVANDRGDMEDIRRFCSPELAAEVEMQYHERNRRPQQTDVLLLNAELLDVSAQQGRMLASVRFSGQIREEAGAAPETFREVWHFAGGAASGQDWLVAGLQQQ